jgi:Mg2+-importing ATPase
MKTFWSQSPEALLTELKTTQNGLTADDAARRLAEHGPNSLGAKKDHGPIGLLLAQFKSPIILILLFATLLSFYLKDVADALIILTIVFISGLLGFLQENGANKATAKLLAMVQIHATALRDGKPEEVAVDKIVPGDIVLLKAGDVIPADGLIITSNSLFIDESTLTGETFPIEKEAGVLPENTALNQRKNALWMGTHVVSGTATAVIAQTGKDTEFGKISEHLRLRPQETEFERGIRRFGYLLMEITLILVIAIFAINVILKRPPLDSFLFSLALAVGLTPQLLPAIISINLAHGSKAMARQKVIVKRLAAIENFGSMNVLCSDKTGTLTAGTVELQGALDVNGQASDQVFLYAFLNATFESGFLNPIDEAIRSDHQPDITSFKKLDEQPYDFTRKRLSVLVAETGQGTERHLMITKGALKNVLAVCTTAQAPDDRIMPIAELQDQINKLYEEHSAKGHRTLGLAWRDLGSEVHVGREHETDMTFMGFLTLYDPLKPGIIDTIDHLAKLGVSLKIITGDNRLVAASVMQQLGIPESEILTGPELREISDSALILKVSSVRVFAEVEPNQKERIIIAFKKAGNVVGYMGDGINDVSALHDADVSISVDSAVDVAKEAADIVLLEQDLEVLTQGVKSGRITFANTLKYVFMATSANFGNMFSMAGASLFLPFLPLLPKQILMTNLMTDFPEMTIASDKVDPEMADRPRRWNIGFIRKFMITFGIISSIFDFMTFGVLLFIVKASENQFRTGWFLESVFSASLIVLVVRTRNPFFRSRPSRFLTLATLGVLVVTFALPLSPLAGILGFVALPVPLLLMLAGIVILYILTAEVAKRFFYKIVKD